jgi:hypothetical protein
VAQERRGKGAGRPRGEGGQSSTGPGQSKRLKPCWVGAENKKMTSAAKAIGPNWQWVE